MDTLVWMGGEVVKKSRVIFECFLIFVVGGVWYAIVVGAALVRNARKELGCGYVHRKKN